MKARPLGRKGVVVGDQVARRRRRQRRRGPLARIVEVLAPHDGAAPHRRRRRPDRARRRRQRRPARDRHRAGRPATPAPADRPLPGRGVRRRHARRCCASRSPTSPTPRRCCSIYRPLDVPSVVDPARRGPRRAARAAADRISVLVGHSGVGKSTLVNALVPDADRAIGAVNDVTGRGRHTSTSALALALPRGGWIIDTPGIRSFGLAHVEPEDLIEAFPDLDEITADCPRGCTHGEREPECALDVAVAAGHRRPRPRRVVPAPPRRAECLRLLGGQHPVASTHDSVAIGIRVPADDSASPEAHAVVRSDLRGRPPRRRYWWKGEPGGPHGQLRRGGVR